MPSGYRQILVGYLLVVGIAIVSMLVALAAVEIPEPPLVPEAWSGQVPEAAADQPSPHSPRALTGRRRAPGRADPTGWRP
jgi:hypothetical protein